MKAPRLGDVRSDQTADEELAGPRTTAHGAIHVPESARLAAVLIALAAGYLVDLLADLPAALAWLAQMAEQDGLEASRDSWRYFLALRLHAGFVHGFKELLYVWPRILVGFITGGIVASFGPRWLHSGGPERLLPASGLTGAVVASSSYVTGIGYDWRPLALPTVLAWVTASALVGWLSGRVLLTMTRQTGDTR